MAIGMSYDEFWNQDVSIARVYLKADEIRRRRQNEVLWLQGLYMRDALCCTVGNMFSDKTAKKFEYPEEPYAITEQQIREQEERKRQQMMARIKAEMEAFAEEMRKKTPSEVRPPTKGGEK